MRFEPKIIFIVYLSMMLDGFEGCYKILVIIADMAMIWQRCRFQNQKWLAPLNWAQNFTSDLYFSIFVQNWYFRPNKYNLAL